MTGGVCWIFAAAGTYKITVQFKASSGNVKVKERNLWAWIIV
jgi:surface-anchored protein